MRVYVDSETCGLHGIIVIIQYAYDDGPIQILDVWRYPIQETLDLIEEMCRHTVVGFNLAFDWFHINKLYNLFRGVRDRLGNIVPESYRSEFTNNVSQWCIKPMAAVDLMLYGRKTDLQITMERKDIVIRRVPNVLANDLAKLLNHKIDLDPILFAGYKTKVAKFRVVPFVINGVEHPHLSNIRLKFRPSGALKAIAEYKLGAQVTKFKDIDIDKKFRPKEKGYKPTESPWLQHIMHHIYHWSFNTHARKYATDDIVHTRNLDKLWNYPQPDIDSVLACSVGACRWKGYAIDVPKLTKVRNDFRARLKYPIAPNRVREYIMPVLDQIELATIANSTSKAVLKEMSGWDHNPEAAKRAKNVLLARAAKKKVELLDKLLAAGRFHASFKVIGALSNRMSGADGLNPQGIDKTKEVRSCFPLADPDEVLLGGDMLSFEITIAEADYGDPKLRTELLKCENCKTVCTVGYRGRRECPNCLTSQIKAYADSPERCKCGAGVKVLDKAKKEYWCFTCQGSETLSFHALFALGFWPDMTYDEVMSTKGTDRPIYNWAKNAAFATLYGAQAFKLMDTLNIQDEELIKAGLLRFWNTYQAAGAKRRSIEMAFASLVQKPNGPIVYKTPNDSISSLLGFKRFFTLENSIIEELYRLAEKPPRHWMSLNDRIVRHQMKGSQTVGNAIRSALYGTAFGLQNTVIRQAANHRIQSTGAGITKAVQARIWEFQPVGVAEWHVRPMNIHDEIQCPTKPEIADDVIQAVYDEIEKFRSIVPLIGIEFGRLDSWSDK